MKNVVALLLAILLSGCARLTLDTGAGGDGVKYDEAEALYRQGNYAGARDAYKSYAESRPESRPAEEARYRAAFILVDYRIPGSDYSLALTEFQEYVNRYPEGRFAIDAGSWLKVLRYFDKSRANELSHEIVALAKNIEELKARLLETQAMRDAALGERDALSQEKTNFIRKLDGLLNEKDAMLKEKSALLKEKEGLMKEKEGLSRDKSGLEKKVDALSKDKENLTAAKEKLEKSLHDLTMVDVKMEKKRKRMK